MDRPIRTKDLKQGAVFRATPHEVYEMLMDSRKHSAFSGDKARISRKVGGSFTAYGGWIKGKNLKLTKDKEIVQRWRGEDWPKDHYSTVNFLLKRSSSGTKLIFLQTGIPADKYSDISSGWKESYWEKMRAALTS